MLRLKCWKTAKVNIVWHYWLMIDNRGEIKKNLISKDNVDIFNVCSWSLIKLFEDIRFDQTSNCWKCWNIVNLLQLEPMTYIILPRDRIEVTYLWHKIHCMILERFLFGQNLVKMKSNLVLSCRAILVHFNWVISLLWFVDYLITVFLDISKIKILNYQD